MKSTLRWYLTPCGKLAPSAIVARPHHGGGGVLVIDQRQQEMFEGSVFVVPASSVPMGVLRCPIERWFL